MVPGLQSGRSFRRARVIELLIVLIILGAGLYVLQLLPIDATIKRIIIVVAIVAVVIWLLRAFAPSLG